MAAFGEMDMLGVVDVRFTTQAPTQTLSPDATAYTIYPSPYTVYLTSYTLHFKPSTLHPTP